MVGTYHIVGPPDSIRTLMFVHGYPDDSSTFRDLATYYTRQGYRCILVDMPYYTAQTSVNQPHFGYDMSGIADYPHGIVEATKGHGSLTFVAHDFGCVYCQWVLAKYPADAGAIVQLDVNWAGLDGTNNETAKAFFSAGRAYQYTNIAYWMLNRTPGTTGLLNVAQLAFPGRFKLTDAVGNDHVIRPASGYSYFYGYLFVLSEYLSKRTDLPQLSLYPDWARNRPEVPTYGKNKPFNFHEDDWAASLSKRRDGSKSVALDTGHWMHLEKPELVKKHMNTFLEEVLGRRHNRWDVFWHRGPSRSDARF